FGRIPFFVVTLGTLAIYQSWALLMSGSGATISLLDVASFQPIANFLNSYVGPIPTILLLILGLYVVGSIVLTLTPFGRAIFAVGSNPEAARLAGINVRLVLASVYAI